MKLLSSRFLAIWVMVIASVGLMVFQGGAQSIGLDPLPEDMKEETNPPDELPGAKPEPGAFLARILDGKPRDEVVNALRGFGLEIVNTFESVPGLVTIIADLDSEQAGGTDRNDPKVIQRTIGILMDTGLFRYVELVGEVEAIESGEGGSDPEVGIGIKDEVVSVKGRLASAGLLVAQLTGKDVTVNLDDLLQSLGLYVVRRFEAVPGLLVVGADLKSEKGNAASEALRTEVGILDMIEAVMALGAFDYAEPNWLEGLDGEGDGIEVSGGGTPSDSDSQISVSIRRDPGTGGVVIEYTGSSGGEDLLLEERGNWGDSGWSKVFVDDTSVRIVDEAKSRFWIVEPSGQVRFFRLARP